MYINRIPNISISTIPPVNNADIMVAGGLPSAERQSSETYDASTLVTTTRPSSTFTRYYGTCFPDYDTKTVYFSHGYSSQNMEKFNFTSLSWASLTAPTWNFRKSSNTSLYYDKTSLVGVGYLSKIRKSFNMTSETWTDQSDWSGIRYGIVCVSYQNTHHLFAGGWDSTPAGTADIHSNYNVDFTNLFTGTQLIDLLTTHKGFYGNGEKTGDKTYYIGGYSGGAGQAGYNHNTEYSYINNSWVVKSVFTTYTRLSYFGCHKQSNGNLYLRLGDTNDNTYEKSAYIYDTLNDTYTSKTDWNISKNGFQSSNF